VLATTVPAPEHGTTSNYSSEIAAWRALSGALLQTRHRSVSSRVVSACLKQNNAASSVRPPAATLIAVRRLLDGISHASGKTQLAIEPLVPAAM